MPFDIDVRELETSTWTVPRSLAGPFAAQDAAARASGLDWHDWARATLEHAARRVVPAATYEPEPDFD